MLNRAELIGRLGADPEVRYTQNEAPVAVFSLATNEQWKDQNGETQQRTEWHRIIAWDNLAKVCEEYLNKGKLVYVEGPLRTRSWKDKEGVTRRVTEIVARTIKILDRKNNGSESAPEQEEGIPF